MASSLVTLWKWRESYFVKTMDTSTPLWFEATMDLQQNCYKVHSSANPQPTLPLNTPCQEFEHPLSSETLNRMKMDMFAILQAKGVQPESDDMNRKIELWTMLEKNKNREDFYQIYVKWSAASHSSRSSSSSASSSQSPSSSSHQHNHSSLSSSNRQSNRENPQYFNQPTSSSPMPQLNQYANTKIGDLSKDVQPANESEIRQYIASIGWNLPANIQLHQFGDLRDTNDNTLVHEAAKVFGKCNVLKALLTDPKYGFQGKSPCTIRNRSGNTPFLRAACAGDIESMDFLLSNKFSHIDEAAIPKISTSTIYKEGLRAVHLAAFNRQPEAVRWLCEVAQAQWDLAVAPYGFNAMVVSFANPSSAGIENLIEIIQYFLDVKKAPIDSLDGSDQGTPLIRSATYNHTAIVQYLVNKGANVFAKTLAPESMTALHFAANHANLEMAKILIKRAEQAPVLAQFLFPEISSYIDVLLNRSHAGHVGRDTLLQIKHILPSIGTNNSRLPAPSF